LYKAHIFQSALAAIYLAIAFIFNIKLLKKNFPDKMAACYSVLIATILVISLINIHLGRVLKQYWLNSLTYQKMMVVLYPEYLRFEQDQLIVDLTMRQGGISPAADLTLAT